MAFWAEPSLEPKRAYRWTMSFGSADGIQEWMIKKVDKPSWSFGESTHQFLNHTFYYPGRITYDEINVSLVDSVEPNGSIVMWNLLRKAGYIRPDEAEINQATVSKQGMVQGAGLGQVMIRHLTPEGDPLEEYLLKNTWIKSCKHSQLDYESDDLVTIDLVLRYDYFKIQAQGGTIPL